MSYSIVTYGFGPNGSVNVIPIYGFTIAEYTDPLIDIEVDVEMVRIINFISNITRSISFEVIL